MKWKPLRIWDWRIKVVYVVVAYALGFGLARLEGFIHDPAVLVSACDIAVILFGARIFRSSGEQIDEPRPWWRMTSRPTMSRRFGILAAVFAGFSVVGIPLLYLSLLTDEPYAPRALASWDSIRFAIWAAEYGVIAFLYLRSARRLGWREPRAPEIASPIRLDK